MRLKWMIIGVCCAGVPALLAPGKSRSRLADV